MDQKLMAEALTGDSDEIEELKANLNILEGFIQLARELDELPEISKRFYEESRSLYQATSTQRSMADLETLLAKFFGPPVKPAGKPLPRKLRKNASVKYLGGIENDQSLFLIPLKTGEFYGALWPWRRNKAKIEIHMGYCSDWMADENYRQLERLVKRSLSRSAFQKIDTSAGGQIRGVGLPSFLQMAEMEQSTFCLMISSPEHTGKLHVAKGVLIDAETVHHTGRDAAYRIIAWEDVAIQIAPADPAKKDEINQPLMHVLMESLKIKDEITASFEKPPVPPPREAKPGPGAPGKRLVRLERAPVPKGQFRRPTLARMAAVAVATLVVGGSLLVLTLYILNIRAETDLFDRLNKEVEKAVAPEEKISLMQKYLKNNPNSPHESAIQERIEAVSNTIQDRDFEQTQLKVSSLPVNEEYESKAISLYGDFLEKYPNSKYQKQINTAITDIKNLLDQYYYEELKQAARLDFRRRLQVYKQYIERFPKGKYQRDVNVLIDEMGQQYLTYLKAEDAQCEKLRRWEPCIERYEIFISEYEGLPLAAAARNTIVVMRDKQELLKLRAEKEQAGNDYERAAQAYQSYLNAHPQTTQRGMIETELAELKKQLGAQRQWESVRAFAQNASNGLYERIQKVDRYLNDHPVGPYAGEAQELQRQLEIQRQESLVKNKQEAKRQEDLARQQREQDRISKQKILAQQTQAELIAQLSRQKRYRVNGQETFTDLKSGQLWTLLDSWQELGGCIDYSTAQKYVQGLQTGGHGDWRLPTANELAAIYKQTPYFPGSGAEWYWTSERYSKGYHTVVDVVTAKPETVFQREQRMTSDCGTVRAIRP